MLQDDIINGSLFSTNFFTETTNLIEGSGELEVARFRKDVRSVFASFLKDKNPNERQTTEKLILPILKLLGWEDVLREQNLAVSGRTDVPDGLLFLNQQKRLAAEREEHHYQRFNYGVAILEVKRWTHPIDREIHEAPMIISPAMQMLRYMRRVDVQTDGKLKWGILTNGTQWRLYYNGARTISEQFFELDLGSILRLKSYKHQKHLLDEEQSHHWLKVFHTVFKKESFSPRTIDDKTYHEIVLDEGRYYEQRVGNSISDKVFNEVFPSLVKAIADASPKTSLSEVRDSALIVLYRLLFILYAEDRELLPVRSEKYKLYSLRENVRKAIRGRINDRYTYSQTATRFWSHVSLLFDLLDKGDDLIGLPQYNGGLFDREANTLITRIAITDHTMAKIIEALSFEKTHSGYDYISYRNLSVQQLGAIYERLLDYHVHRVDDEVVIRPSTFSRKNTGSYYTSEDLVKLVIKETIQPLIDAKKQEFIEKFNKFKTSTHAAREKSAYIRGIDLTSSILKMRICDPAMGSGHFLVCLVDYLADEVSDAIATVENLVHGYWGEYKSPIIAEIDDIRTKIICLAFDSGWEYDGHQLDDRRILRRIILKRCIYGVDKNPMAVELAKVSLWLHTFTVGAPLSFIDHHLKCGDSLIGLWLTTAQTNSDKYGSPLMWSDQLQRLYGTTKLLETLEMIPDSEVSDMRLSFNKYEESEKLVAPLNDIMNFIQALDWIDLKDKDTLASVQGFFDSRFGDQMDIVHGKEQAKNGSKDTAVFEKTLSEVRKIIDRERFLNWQMVFPSVWTDWDKEDLVGGFDAIVGNPPWDRTKLEQVEWFSERQSDIAFATRASDRKAMIKKLVKSNDSLAQEYKEASNRSDSFRKLIRDNGEYPLLSGGDVNLYSLFVERAMKLVKPDGRVGLLVPSGIAHDKTASKFFRSVSTNGQVRTFYDFENGRREKGKQRFFPDVDSRFKFCTLILSKQPSDEPIQCAFFLHDVSEIEDDETTIALKVSDFQKFNPNTCTLPIFRTKRDAALATRIYDTTVPLVVHAENKEIKAWPVRFTTMFHMTNDSGLFRSEEELRKKEKAYHIGENVFDSANGKWLPLYVGRMFNQYDHRAASVYINEKNLKNPNLSELIPSKQKQDPSFVPKHVSWVNQSQIRAVNNADWYLAFRSTGRVTDIRTMIASAIPRSGVGNTAQLLLWEGDPSEIGDLALLLANFNSLIFDYTVRQKVQATALNWYIVEQLPVVERNSYNDISFGPKTASEVVKETVLELTYTAHNMAPFAKDMGYTSDDDQVNPPFKWDELQRVKLKAKLDAVYFYLYGLTEPTDVEYIYSSFPIVKRENKRNFQNADIATKLCLDYLNALSAGDPDASIAL